MSPKQRKPSLAGQTFRQQLLAAVIALLAVLAGLLWLTDRVMLVAHGRALHHQLGAVDSADNAVLLLSDLSEKMEAGSLLLDTRGRWRRTERGIAVHPRGREAAGQWQRWSQAADVVRLGSSRDIGALPWLDEPVVWAAQLLHAPDGSDEILVAWEPVRALRRALLPVYALVVGATLAIFAASTLLALRGARQVARALGAVADSGVRMAGGDYAVELAPQPTRELDDVATSMNQLARSLRETIAALEAEHDRLVRLEGAQREFVADTSHELRAPLTFLRLTLESWQDGLLTPEELPTAVGHMLQETERLTRLVTVLLDLSHIESGRMPLQTAAVDVGEVIADASSALQDSAGARIEVEMAEATPLVLADAEALPRVLLNLLTNARRFTPADGSIHVWARPEQGAVRVGVTDTGCGIDPTLLPRIWDRFARGGTRPSDAAGCGLGLAIVKALVEAMGGQVGAESSAGCGATVWFQLPAAGRAETTPAAPMRRP